METNRLGTDKYTEECIEGFKFKCDICSKLFNRKDSLKRHYISVHHTEKLVDNVKRTKCFHSGCSKELYHNKKLLEHMKAEHNINIQGENLTFDSIDEFMKWKEEEEASNYVYFSKHGGDKVTKNGSISYYYCQFDGVSKPHRK